MILKCFLLWFIIIKSIFNYLFIKKSKINAIFIMITIINHNNYYDNEMNYNNIDIFLFLCALAQVLGVGGGFSAPPGEKIALYLWRWGENLNAQRIDIF